MIQDEKIATKLHAIPKYLQQNLTDTQVFFFWSSLTPLAKNEWICWIDSAKKNETRNRRMQLMNENLLVGKKRPCCWAGCPHR